MDSQAAAGSATHRIPGGRIDPAAAPAVVTPSCKLATLKRAGPEDRTIMTSPPPKKKPRSSKRTPEAKPLVPKGLTHLEPKLALEVQQTMSDPVEPTLIRSSMRLKTRCTARKPEVGYAVKISQSHVDALEETSTKAQVEIAHLQQELEDQRKMYEQQQLKLKQDFVLDMMKARDMVNKKINGIHREKHFLQLRADEQKKEAADLKARLDSQSTRFTKALADATLYRQEYEYLQHANKTLEEDLDALRQLENEEAARRKKAEGLPPAYGSLDQEDQLPPWQLHKDAGRWDVATLKRDVRSQFTHTLLGAHKHHKAPQSGTNVKEINVSQSSMFYSTSLSLRDRCRSLKCALESAPYLDWTKRAELQAKNTDPSHSERDRMATAKAPLREYHRNAHRQQHEAARIAKLILELSWRVVGASELHPMTIPLTKNANAELGLVYKDIDDCLLDALRHTFQASQSVVRSTTDRKAEALFEQQAYLSQVQALRMKMFNLGAGVSYEFFSRSLSWLCEKVEVERSQQAQALSLASAARPTTRVEGPAVVVERPSEVALGVEVSAVRPVEEHHFNTDTTVHDVAASDGRRA